MKKNLLLTVLTMACIVSMAYGFMQKAQAESARLMALENRILAEENEKIAQKQFEIAAAHRAEAEHQRALAAEALAHCLKNRQ